MEEFRFVSFFLKRQTQIIILGGILKLDLEMTYTEGNAQFLP